MTASCKLRFLYRERLKQMSLKTCKTRQPSIIASHHTWLLITSIWRSLFFETDDNSKVGQGIMLAMMLLAVVPGSK